MSTKTANYNLVKPEFTDAADITAMNPNWDTIDTTLKGLDNDKVSDTGDTLTGMLTFQNLDAYHAIQKYRTILGETYGVNLGCGKLGGAGVATVECRYGNDTTSPTAGRLEIGARGVSFVDTNGKRTYLVNTGLTEASVE